MQLGAYDSIQPGTELGLTPEIRQRTIGFNKYILRDLFRIFPDIGET